MRSVRVLAAGVGFVLAAESLAYGQSRRGFAVARYEPAERGAGWFVVDMLDFRGRARPFVGASLDHAYKPLVVYDQAQNERLALVRHQLFAHVGASFVIADRYRFAVDAPFAVHQDGEAASIGGTRHSPPTSAAFGDVRLATDVRIFGQHTGPITVAAGLRGWLPTGVPAQFTSDGSLRVAPQLLVAGSVGPFVWAARAAYVVRPRDDYGGTKLGSEVTFALGAGARLGRFRLGPELFASTGAATGAFLGRLTTPADVLLGVHYTHPSGARFGAAIGSGLTRGNGSPAMRGVLSLEWGPPIADAPPDRDEDGIDDASDACPTVPGMPSGDPEENGCPAPEPVLDEDTDGDHIGDRDDACPGLAGVPTTDPMTNGCPPDLPRPLAVVTRGEIRIGEEIRFATDSAELVESDAVLDAVKRILDEHPDLQRVRVEGHTDAAGDPKYNEELSTRRANAVVRWLVDHGVDGARLEGRGYGSSKPIASNDTDEGRAKNRRVVFTIVEQAPGKVPGR